MTLKEARQELRNAWIDGECYDYDQTFIVCYKDGNVLDTREANEKLPIKNIIGIQFFGTDASFAVGHEIYKNEMIELTI